MRPPRNPSHAYEAFATEVRRLRAPGALLRAAAAVALHEMPETDPAEVERQVEDLAARVRVRTTTGRTAALLAHLHQVLFEEEGYRGDVEHVDDPRNSYLPWILEHRRGLPITLTLLYRCVARRVGLVVRGLNTPGHFLALVEGDGAPMIVDPFGQGRVLSRDEVFGRIAEATGIPVLPTEGAFPEATPRAWLYRILQNLVLGFRRRGREEDARTMLEMQALVR